MELAAMVGLSSATTAAAGTGMAAAGASAASAAAAGAAASGGFMAQIAAAGAAPLASSSLFSLSSLGTGLSLASMASSLFGGAQQGKAQADALKQQAQEDMLTATQEEIKGKQQANDIQDSLLQTIAQQRLAFSGAGIDPTFGTPDSLANETRRIAEMQLSTSRDNTQMTVLSRRRQGFARLSQVGAAQSAGVMQGVSSAGATLSDLIDRRTRRG